MSDNLQNLRNQELYLFQKIAQGYKDNNVAFVMADNLPQRGRILDELGTLGVEAHIVGGAPGQRYFNHVTRHYAAKDTFCDRSAEGSISQVTAGLPEGLFEGRNLAFFNFTPFGNRQWSNSVTQRAGGRVIATCEQNLRDYFEEKANLTNILRLAGLSEHAIPSRVIPETTPIASGIAKLLYEKYADEGGKIVVQFCGEGYDEVGGGHSTIIARSFEEFNQIATHDRPGAMKVATFITGSNSNLSICVGNTIPSQTSLGAVKGEILPTESLYSVETLIGLKYRAKELGINPENIVVNVHPGTLKVVGAPELTTIQANGVGNQLNYQFAPETLEQIYSIGSRFGTFMALCGKVGMCGLDLIVTRDGQVFINEINDRQQGPTESASLNNEANGLPGIHRESFILNYASLNDPEVIDYLQAMNAESKEIYDQSTQIPSPFYIKVCGPKTGLYTKYELKEGTYPVTHDEEGVYHWDLQTPVAEEHLPEVDITASETEVKVDTTSYEAGAFIPEGSQIMRINGLATKETSPFTINEDGVSVLNEDWKAPISALYADGFSLTPIQQSNASLQAPLPQDPVQQ